jgi:hypothetical protein
MMPPGPRTRTAEDLVGNEEDAAATTQAILEVVASVRSKERLVD